MDTFFLILKFLGCRFALSFVCVAFFCLGAIMCKKAEDEARAQLDEDFRRLEEKTSGTTDVYP